VALSARAVRRLLAGAVLGLAAYYAVWGGEYSAFHLVRLDRDRAAAEARLARVTAEVDSLRALATTLERDDAAVERIARERFGMVREGEILYRFVPVEAEGASGEAPGVDRP
jgi:cell division protein FtsB